MGERKGVNKYYPPDWTPAMGSINKYHGTHALRERARKLKDGILIIRFEMPYNIWCGGCGNHIGMGVRYNAEKKKIGMYYTTPLYQFRMKCHLCTNHFEIKTDPQNLDYVIVSGARRQEGRWDPKTNEQVVPEDKKTSEKLATDAMFKLEHGVSDQEKSRSVAPSLAKLECLQSRWKDDYLANKILRKVSRDKKKEIKNAANEDRLLLTKSSLNIALLPEDPNDVKLASLLKLVPVEDVNQKREEKRIMIRTESIFKTQQQGLQSNITISKPLATLIQKSKQSCTPCRGLSATHLGVVVTKKNVKSPTETDKSDAEGVSLEQSLSRTELRPPTNLVAYEEETSDSECGT